MQYILGKQTQLDVTRPYPLIIPALHLSLYLHNQRYLILFRPMFYPPTTNYIDGLTRSIGESFNLCDFGFDYVSYAVLDHVLGYAFRPDSVFVFVIVV